MEMISLGRFYPTAYTQPNILLWQNLILIKRILTYIMSSYTMLQT